MAGAFSRKPSGISCDLTAFRKIKEHRANAVETPLGVTGLLSDSSSLSSLCEHACACVCVHVFVEATETITLLSHKSQARKTYYSYFTLGAVARSVACNLHKQVLRSILAPGTFFRGK